MEGLSFRFPSTDKSTSSHLGTWWLIHVSFHWSETASLKTYHRMGNTLSQSTPRSAGLEWSGCRYRTTCHKRRIWSTLFSHTATCVGGQRGCEKENEDSANKRRRKRSMRERIWVGREEECTNVTLDTFLGNLTPCQPYLTAKWTMAEEKGVWFHSPSNSMCLIWKHPIFWWSEEPLDLCFSALLPANVGARCGTYGRSLKLSPWGRETESGPSR